MFVIKIHMKNCVARKSFFIPSSSLSTLPWLNITTTNPKDPEVISFFSLLNSLINNTSIESYMNDEGRSFISDLFKDLLYPDQRRQYMPSKSFTLLR